MSPFQGQRRRIVHNIFQTSSRHIRPPHFASKVSYSASPQSLAAKKFVNSFNSLLRRLRPPIKFVVMLRPNKFRCILCPQLPPIKKVSRSGHPFQFFLHHYFKTALAHRGNVDARLLRQLFCRETLSRQVIQHHWFVRVLQAETSVFHDELTALDDRLVNPR